MNLESAYLLHRERVLTWVVLAGVPEADAEDVTHAVFEVLASVNTQTIPDRALPMWLRRTARHVAWRHLRRLGTRREDVQAEEPESFDEAPDEALAGREVEAQLRRLVGDLRPERREIVERHVLGEEPVEDIAAAQGVPLETARKRLRLARRDLRAAAERARERERFRSGAVSFAFMPWLFSRRAWALAIPVLGAVAVVVAIAWGEPPRLAPTSIALPERPHPEAFRPAFSMVHAERERSVEGRLFIVDAVRSEKRGDVHKAEPSFSVRLVELPEVDLVDLARRALADGSPARARAYLARAAAAYPDGSLAPERATLLSRLP